MKLFLHASAFAMSAISFAISLTAPVEAQSNILLQLRSGSPLGDRFRVDSAGGFVAVSQLGVGGIPVSGAGYRFMYIPSEAALRVGFVSSTQWDQANIGPHSFAGGANPIASGYASIAFGTQLRVTSSYGAAFGASNHVGGQAGFAAGTNNYACGFASVAIGAVATAGNFDSFGNCVNGSDGAGAVALGQQVTADADHAVAIGYHASAKNHSGVFLFGDASTEDSIQALVNNEFAARAAGGFRFHTNATLTTGCILPAGSGAFACASSRTLKDRFDEVDGEEVLARIRGIPVNRWSYLAEVPESRHLGPFAEDFYAAFGLGSDPKAIGLLDIGGVNFAAVKALEERTSQLQAKQAEIDGLRLQVQQMDTRLRELEALVRRAGTGRP